MFFFSSCNLESFLHHQMLFRFLVYNFHIFIRILISWELSYNFLLDFSYYGDMKTHMHTVIDVYEELSKDWRGCIMEPTIEEVQKCEFHKLKNTLSKLDRFLHFKECVESKNVKSKPCTRTHFRKYTKVTAQQKVS